MPDLEQHIIKTARRFSPIRWAGKRYSQSDGGHLLEFVIKVLTTGTDPLNDAGIPVISPYGLPLVYPEEIRGVNEALARIRTYLDDIRTRNSRDNAPTFRPLNIVILAPPGGGKSTAAEGFAKAIKEHGSKQSAMTYLKFNASQYDSINDFRGMWEEVRYESALKPVLCFIDEFDVGHFRWIAQFLAPMNDGMTFEPQAKKFGPVVFVFGGGVFDCSAKLLHEARYYSRYDKLSDFVRRVDVWLDLMPVAFPWENKQLHTESMSVLHQEVFSERNLAIDWERNRLILRPSAGGAILGKGLPPLLATIDLKTMGFTVQSNCPTAGDPISEEVNGSAGGNLAAGSSEEKDKGDRLQYEIFFSLLKRALFLRHQIENRRKGSEHSDARPHKFVMNSKEKEWISKKVALFLLHPAMRLRDGLGSLEKFIRMIDFRLDHKFELRHLPDPAVFGELLDIGPQELPADLRGSWYRNQMEAIRSGDPNRISWPPNLR